jgi:hypothetical protein
MTASGTNLFTGWVGGPDAVFEILAPAFDPAIASAAAPAPGTAVWLKGGVVGGNSVLIGGGAATNGVELIDVVSPTKIVVRLNLPAGA